MARPPNVALFSPTTPRSVVKLTGVPFATEMPLASVTVTLRVDWLPRNRAGCYLELTCRGGPGTGKTIHPAPGRRRWQVAREATPWLPGSEAESASGVDDSERNSSEASAGEASQAKRRKP